MTQPPRDLDVNVRLCVYDLTRQSGVPPLAAEVAHLLDADADTIEQSFRRLAEDRVLVLQPDSGEILMANPFSAVPTPFFVEVGALRCWGNCIWDAMGIPAMMRRDATIITSCACCGESLDLVVLDGDLVSSNLADPDLSTEDGIVHFAVPARKWWEDIVFT